METKVVTCIVCPVGCEINVEFDSFGVQGLAGNQCARGASFAEEECLRPCRTLTTTIKVTGGAFPVAPVRTDKPIAKDQVFNVMALIRESVVSAPYSAGDVVLRGVAGTDANVVLTRGDRG